jgi:branched-subunit amino acid aminotransferase/4-amino-4-deoxychorismate lyase
MNLGPAILYGESIFTSMRSVGGVVPGFELHLNRLFEHCNDYYFHGKLSRSSFDGYFFKDTKWKMLIDKSPNHYFRLTIYAKDKRDQILPVSFTLTDLTLNIDTKQLGPIEAEEKLEQGLKLKTFPSPFSEHHIKIKAGSYFQNLYFKRQAQAARFDDALFYSANKITEASTSNIIFQKGHDFILPSNQQEIFQGIGQHLFKAFLMSKNYVLTLRTINTHELGSFDACYLLNSVSFISGVKQIDCSYYKLNGNVIDEYIEYLTKSNGVQ